MTNIIEYGNVIDTDIENGIIIIVVLDSGKAVYPISDMGMLKALSEKI